MHHTCNAPVHRPLTVWCTGVLGGSREVEQLDNLTLDCRHPRKQYLGLQQQQQQSCYQPLQPVSARHSVGHAVPDAADLLEREQCAACSICKFYEACSADGLTDWLRAAIQQDQQPSCAGQLPSARVDHWVRRCSTVPSITCRCSIFL